jgi:V-type H+-transporting ATPase subunit F
MMDTAGPPPEGSLLAIIGDEVRAWGGLSLRPRPRQWPFRSHARLLRPPSINQDTVTGFLLAGVGHVDLRRHSNFLIVNDSAFLFRSWATKERAEKTQRALFPRPRTLPFSLTAHTTPTTTKHSRTTTTETPAGRIEAAFREFTARPDIAVVLVTQAVAEEIRPAIAAHAAAVPAILEIPSKDTPYNPAKDGVLARVRHLLGGEGGGGASAAAGRG